jgi:hypothetical protein
MNTVATLSMPQRIERYEVCKSGIQLLLPPASARILPRSWRIRGCYYLPLSKGLRSKQHFPSKQVTNHQDCVGCVLYTTAPGTEWAQIDFKPEAIMQRAFLRTMRVGRPSRTIRLDVAAAVKYPRQATHQLSKIGQRRPDGHFQFPSGRPVRSTGWLREIYLIDDTELGFVISSLRAQPYLAVSAFTGRVN